MNNKKLLLLLIALIPGLQAAAQNMFSMASQHPADTVRSESQEQALRFPSVRPVSVTTDLFGSAHFDTKLNGKDLASGESRNARISSYITVPFSKWDGNQLGATIYHTVNYYDIRSVSDQTAGPMINTGNRSKSSLGLSLNFSRTDALFHTPVIYSAVFTGISDNLRSVKRFNFNGGISFPLKRTEDTYLSIGALVQIDPSAPVPVLPVVNYFHNLNGSGLQLIVELPQGAMVKQRLASKAWAYLGTNYNTYATFYGSNDPALPDRFSYNTIEIKIGPGFEFQLGKYVILGVNGGISSLASARAFAKGKDFNDYFLKTTSRSVGYGEFKISLLPF